MSLDKKSPDLNGISPISSVTTDPSTLSTFQVLPKIFQEGILFIASGPALLLQAAQPGLNHAATTDTSTNAHTNTNLSKDLTTPLHSTLAYIACLLFGTQAEKEALVGRLRLGQPPLAPHAAAGGITSSTGSPIQVTASRDSNAQLWMLATIYATATDVYQRIYGEFDYRTSEKAYAEFALLLPYLSLHSSGLPPGLWPSTRAEFWRYWDDQMRGLVVSGEARKFADELMSRRDLPRGVGSLRPVLRAVTVEMLPAAIRDGYGLKSTAGTRGVYRTAMGFSVAVWPALPRGVRAYPVNSYVKEVKRCLEV
ncbi:hypothetical protein BJX99DRAFT_248104 [Aspergillus californicus]